MKKICGIINFELADFPDIKLKPCPFCGSEELELINTHTPYYWIECVSCCCELTCSGDYANTVADHKKAALNVIGKWNRRQ